MNYTTRCAAGLTNCASTARPWALNRGTSHVILCASGASLASDIVSPLFFWGGHDRPLIASLASGVGGWHQAFPPVLGSQPSLHCRSPSGNWVWNLRELIVTNLAIPDRNEFFRILWRFDSVFQATWSYPTTHSMLAKAQLVRTSFKRDLRNHSGPDPPLLMVPGRPPNVPPFHRPPRALESSQKIEPPLFF